MTGIGRWRHIDCAIGIRGWHTVRSMTRMFSGPRCNACVAYSVRDRTRAAGLHEREVREAHESNNGDEAAHGIKLSGYGARTEGSFAVYRRFLYIRSISSSYIGSACSGPALMAEVTQCFRWLRMSSRPTPRSASCTEEICVRMSAQ